MYRCECRSLESPMIKTYPIPSPQFGATNVGVIIGGVNIATTVNDPIGFNDKNITAGVWHNLRKTIVKELDVDVRVRDHGIRLMINDAGDFSRIPGHENQIQVLGGIPLYSCFWQDHHLGPQLSGANFAKHNKNNVLYHMANRISDKYSFVANLTPLESSSENFTVYQDGSPKAKIHRLIIAKGGYITMFDLPCEQWEELRQLLILELNNLHKEKTPIQKGFRIIINSGPDTQAIPQLHLHMLAGEQLGSPFPGI